MRVVGVPKFHSWCKYTMSELNHHITMQLLRLKDSTRMFDESGQSADTGFDTEQNQANFVHKVTITSVLSKFPREILPEVIGTVVTK